MSRSDSGAEKQHILDEVQTERIQASNSPPKEVTPRQSMYSDISSAGLSDGRQSSPKAPPSRSAIQPEVATNISHSTPTVGSRKKTGTEQRTDVVRALSTHSKMSSGELTSFIKILSWECSKFEEISSWNLVTDLTVIRFLFSFPVIFFLNTIFFFVSPMDSSKIVLTFRNHLAAENGNSENAQRLRIGRYNAYGLPTWR